MSDTTTTAKWINKMSNLIRHILPGILFSFLVWCVLAHLEVLVQFAEDLIAASPHDRAMIAILYSAFAFMSYVTCIFIVNLPKMVAEMIKQMRHTGDVQK
ncbi:hypothetical protein [Actinomyces oris]|jgi:hypothetical protein|uniref:hypothetical protein n=1 Tax=Actinomyces oris TaxID=544580 RepID=UPI0028D8AFA0|nr:hypothetical protein [Actinomyces oris]